MDISYQCNCLRWPKISENGNKPIKRLRRNCKTKKSKDLHLWVYENQDQLYVHNVELYDNEHHHRLVVFCLEKLLVAFEKLFHSGNFHFREKNIDQLGILNRFIILKALPVRQPIAGLSFWIGIFKNFYFLKKNFGKKTTKNQC